MTPLRRTAEVSRLIIKWGAVGLVALMVGRFTIGTAIRWYKQQYPKIPEPTIGFGILPPVVFPESEPKSLTYRLETVTGGLPKFPTQAEVLYMQISRPNLLAMERAQQTAAALGFKVQPEKVSDTSYKWQVTNPLPMSLLTSIYDGRLIWKTDWTTDPNFLASKKLPSDVQARKEARDWVRKIEPLAADILEGETEVTYLKGSGGTFIKTTSLAEADFVQVNLFRKPYQENFQFVTPKPDQGVVRVTLSGNQRAGRVIQLAYNYFLASYDMAETYPLRPVDQAWQELQQGKGYIASLDAGITEVVVRRVTLGYFDSFEPQQYMQPVYVFTGDNNFIGYVQAVKDPKTSQEE